MAVLGLAFKPGTDDLREAPALENVKLLLENGAQVVAYDPVAADNFRKVYPEGAVGRGSIAYSETPEETLKDAISYRICTTKITITHFRKSEVRRLFSPHRRMVAHT